MMDATAYHALYRILAALDFPAPTVNGTDMPGIAWPESMTGVASEHERVPVEWEVARLTDAEMRALDSALSKLSLLSVRHRLRLSGDSATRRISSDEQSMLDALLTEQLPVPDRNHAVRDDVGKWWGVIDFAWEHVNDVEVKVALEVDGWHWHVGKDIAEEIASFAADVKAAGSGEVEKLLQKELRQRGVKDAAKRRILMEHGWIVIPIHDTEIRSGPARVSEIAQQVRRTVEARYSAGLRMRTPHPDPVGGS
jgi:hypothetical protein